MKYVRKENLPEKECAVCGRRFVWRRKWRAVWDEIKYCGERCRRNKNPEDPDRDDKGALIG